MNNDVYYQMANAIMQANPNLARTPQGQQFMQILQSGDVNACQQMGMNICNSYGLNPQQALAQSLQGLIHKMKGR